MQSDEHTESGDLIATGTPDAVIEGIESPYDVGGSRSIVAIHLKDAPTFEPFMQTFLYVQQASDISGLGFDAAGNALPVVPDRLRRLPCRDCCPGGRD